MARSSSLRSVLGLAVLALGSVGCSAVDDDSGAASSTVVEPRPAAQSDDRSTDTDSAGSRVTTGSDGGGSDGGGSDGGEEPAETVDSAGEDEQPTESTSTSAGDGQPGDLADRLAAYLLANPDGLEIDEGQAACTGQSLAETLPANRLELLVTNLEELDEVEDGRQFSDDERLVIAESFAACLDFGVLVDEVVLDEPSIAAVVECIATTAGPDRVEAVMLAGALGDDVSDPRDSVLLEGLNVCPVAARESLAAYLDERFFAAGTDVVGACLDAYTDEQLEVYLTGSEDLFDLADDIFATCVPAG